MKKILLAIVALPILSLAGETVKVNKNMDVFVQDSSGNWINSGRVSSALKNMDKTAVQAAVNDMVATEVAKDAYAAKQVVDDAKAEGATVPAAAQSAVDAAQP